MQVGVHMNRQANSFSKLKDGLYTKVRAVAAVWVTHEETDRVRTNSLLILTRLYGSAIRIHCDDYWLDVHHLAGSK